LKKKGENQRAKIKDQKAKGIRRKAQGENRESDSRKKVCSDLALALYALTIINN
jgi:hypothetical protein